MPANRPFYVYVLFDWLGIPRYVGKGKGGRIDGHYKSSDPHNLLKNEFIERTWRMLDEVPRVKVSDNLTEAEAFKIEMALIAAIGRLDQDTGPLTNMTDGGEGCTKRNVANHAKRSQSAQRWQTELTRFERAAMRANQSTGAKRRWSDPKQREENGARVRALWQDPEFRKLQEAAALVRGAGVAELWADPIHKARRSENIRKGKAALSTGQKHASVLKRLASTTPEQRSASTANWHANMTEEARASRGRAISRALTGREFPGDREQLSASVKHLWMNPEYRTKQLKRNPHAKGTVWITNGQTNRRVKPDAILLDGWYYGKVRKVPPLE